MAKRFGVMLDMSRNAVMKPEQVKKFALTIQKLGYNMIQLYTEDTYEIPEEPYFGYLRGRNSQEELKDIVSYCNSIGVEVIPCIQTLAHLNQIFRWEPYRKINDCTNILLAEEERTYALIENMFRSVRACFTTDCIHIGMDEAHMLGLGKYLDLHGPQNRFDILKRHLEKVIELAKKYGFRPIMWSDMFFRLANHGTYYTSDASIITEEIVAACPSGVDLVYWDYYQNDKAVYDAMLDAHAKFGGEAWFAGGAWTWIGFASNNRWTMESMSLAMQSCAERGVEQIMLTMWGDNGKECSFYKVLPSLYAVRRIYDGVTDMEQIKREFEERIGESFDDMMLLDLAMDFGEIKRKNSTPHKYMLYSDPLLGYLDPAVTRNRKDEYEALAAQLEQAAKKSNFAYLFESDAALCHVLALKFDLGVRTRAVYKAGDKQEMETLIADYVRTEQALEAFVPIFRKLWFAENKPHGFDVQELRLGGLMLRLRSTRERLSSYLAGEIDSIPELEEELLPYMGLKCHPNGGMPDINSWQSVVSPNVI
jgi:hypothetical protein